MLLGVQHQMERAKGVIRSTVGYTGGKEQHPTYQEVKAHTTGHAEAVLVEYDAEQTTYKELCKLFFEIHDPAQTDGQGPDIGPQYRSEIFYLNEAQKAEAEAIIQLLREKGYEVNTALLRHPNSGRLKIITSTIMTRQEENLTATSESRSSKHKREVCHKATSLSSI